MDRVIDGQMDIRTDEWRDIWMDGWMDRLIDGQMDIRMDEWRDIWMDR